MPETRIDMSTPQKRASVHVSMAVAKTVTGLMESVEKQFGISRAETTAVFIGAMISNACAMATAACHEATNEDGVKLQKDMIKFIDDFVDRYIRDRK